MIDYDNSQTPTFTKVATISCDDCQHEDEILGLSFKETVQSLRDNGWAIIWDGETKTWYHYCPLCKGAQTDIL